MSSINITIYGLVFAILLALVYFLKKRINLTENKVYSLLIISAIISSIVEVISFVFVVNGADETSFGYALTLKVLFEFLLIWVYMFTLYFIIITIKNTHSIKKIIHISFVILFIVLALVSFLPVVITNNGGMLLPGGPSVMLIYAACALCIILMIYLIFKNLRKIKEKKYWPLYIMLIVFASVVLLQNMFPDFLLINPAFVFITWFMYFTIENPDIRMIEQLNIARNQAEKANSAKTDFLSNMSHEIRTPLNAIVGFSNLLLENKDIPEKSKDEVRDIIMASNNLLEIVNGILDISKIEANKLEIIDAEYSINIVLKELVALTKGRLGDKPIELKVNFDKSISPVLYGDCQRLKQVCVNILTNAVKYTKEGWIEFKVSSVKKDNICRLIISVEDTGVGIKQENIDKLFNRFERLDLEENVTIEGTGLGLAITKKLVDLMGGKIVVQSVYGKGSKFTVSIDQRIVENPTIKIDNDYEENKEVIKIENKKILLVDDNKINLKVAERLLQGYGVTTESVESGFDAIDKIKSGNTYDLILLDDMMPKMSGVETLQKLKELEGFNIPTIALTANALTGMKEKYLADGFNDYLSKPINKDELNRVIEEYLNK